MPTLKMKKLSSGECKALGAHLRPTESSPRAADIFCKRKSKRSREPPTSTP